MQLQVSLKLESFTKNQSRIAGNNVLKHSLFSSNKQNNLVKKRLVFTYAGIY